MHLTERLLERLRLRATPRRPSRRVRPPLRLRLEADKLPLVVLLPLEELLLVALELLRPRLSLRWRLRRVGLPPPRRLSRLLLRLRLWLRLRDLLWLRARAAPPLAARAAETVAGFAAAAPRAAGSSETAEAAAWRSHRPLGVGAA